MATPRAAIRSAVTAIVGLLPGKAGAEVRTTKEQVPFREELFRDQDFVASTDGIALRGIADALHKIQRHVAEATQSARSLPVLGGAYWPGVALSGTPNVIAHGIPGQVSVSFLVASMRSVSSNVAVSVVETAQDPTTGRVSVAVQPSGVSVIADLWFFPRPVVT